MAGGSLDHSRLAARVSHLIRAGLGGRPRETFTSDARSVWRRPTCRRTRCHRDLRAARALSRRSRGRIESRRIGRGPERFHGGLRPWREVRSFRHTDVVIVGRKGHRHQTKGTTLETTRPRGLQTTRIVPACRKVCARCAAHPRRCAASSRLLPRYSGVRPCHAEVGRSDSELDVTPRKRWRQRPPHISMIIRIRR